MIVRNLPVVLDEVSRSLKYVLREGVSRASLTVTSGRYTIVSQRGWLGETGVLLSLSEEE